MVGRHVSEVVIQAIEAWSPEADSEQMAEETQWTILQRQERVLARSRIEREHQFERVIDQSKRSIFHGL
jgi:hypothetical protein